MHNNIVVQVHNRPKNCYFFQITLIARHLKMKS